MKGLDNSTPESYSKLSRFLLGGRPRGSSCSLPFSTFPALPHASPLPSSPFTLRRSASPAQAPTFLRQFDKMQISFVSLTTIGFSAYSSSFRLLVVPFRLGLARRACSSSFLLLSASRCRIVASEASSLLALDFLCRCSSSMSTFIRLLPTTGTDIDGLPFLRA